MSNYLNAYNADYIDQLLTQYTDAPSDIDPSWRFFFDGMAVTGLSPKEAVQVLPGAALLPKEELEHEVKVIELIQGYREMAYLIADVNPLDRTPKRHPLLELDNFRLKESDLDKVTHVGQLLGLGSVPLRDILNALKTYYCSPIAVEIAHIEDPKSRHWIQKRMESKQLLKPLKPEYKQRAHQKLAEAEAFETFVHKRFVGQKRFSLEGNDVVIPMLDYLIDQASSLGADEIIFGMAHRGRLNVLANIFKKDLKSMFAEFSGNLEVDYAQGDGDVKYHLGYSSDTESFSGRGVHISLVPNPSHLEAINSVVMGITRAKQSLKGDFERDRTLAVLLHGDASFAGQGSVYEVLNMSELNHYSVGGTVHIIVNNQVGFTTDPSDSRSTPYATDIAKMLEIPIFRVNGDEPEAVLRCVAMALQYRYAFKRDVVIDVLGYRRYGHNEGDEPTFTQPLLYKKIAAHPRVYELYTRQLISDGLHTEATARQEIDRLYEHYDLALQEAKKSKISPKMAAFGKRWTDFRGPPNDTQIFEPVSTEITEEVVQRISKVLLEMPAHLQIHPKIKRFLDDRREMLSGARGLDWSLAEALSFGSLMLDGYAIRLAGQDVIRGTFSHRHAGFFDNDTGACFIPLRELNQGGARFEVFNSLLSEMAALGFEFGQSLANPAKLTLWEAQFGDFANGAQIIIDQFITSSAVKWQRYSGLVMLLPHGYEGQGPEHSSGRIERFLQACAQHNIQVCNLTTPAQYFHVLRRQMLRPYRLPLVIMSPKSLLRHPKVLSSLSDLKTMTFQEMIDEPDSALKKKATKLVICTGKVYYDLIEARDSRKSEVPIVRIEQLYPFNQSRFKEILSGYPKLKEIVWCQEEPQNMGGYAFILQSLMPLLAKEVELRYVGRQAQASPSHGYMHLHHLEQEQIVLKALGAL